MEKKIQSYRDLQVWRKARALVKFIYVVSQEFPREELYGLTSQIRRAAVSIPSNIAEGSSKGPTKEFIRFITIACGSLAEVETHIYLASDLDYIAPKRAEEILALTSELGRMLKGLQRLLEQRLMPAELRTPNSELSNA